MNASPLLLAWLYGWRCRACGRRPWLGTDAACRCGRWNRWMARGRAVRAVAAAKAGWGA